MARPTYTDEQRAEIMRRMIESAADRGGVPDYAGIAEEVEAAKTTLIRWWKARRQKVANGGPVISLHRGGGSRPPPSPTPQPDGDNTPPVTIRPDEPKRTAQLTRAQQLWEWRHQMLQHAQAAGSYGSLRGLSQLEDEAWIAARQEYERATADEGMTDAELIDALTEHAELMPAEHLAAIVEVAKRRSLA